MTCICSEVDNLKFDSILKSEISLPIDIDEIINKSIILPIHLDIDFSDVALDSNEILSVVRNKMGIYHLWVEHDDCLKHDKRRMLCAYVGKGYVDKRVKTHIKDKWVKDETLYLSFYECENRIAKYLEQLFLDTYNFHLNKEENTGVGFLQTLWDDFQYRYGTQLDEQVDLLIKKNPEVYNP